MPQTCEKSCYFCQPVDSRIDPWTRHHHGCINEYSFWYRTDCYGKEICECHMTWKEINNLPYKEILCEKCPNWIWSAGCGWFCKKKKPSHNGKPGFCISFPLHTLKEQVKIA